MYNAAESKAECLINQRANQRTAPPSNEPHQPLSWSLRDIDRIAVGSVFINNRFAYYRAPVLKNHCSLDILFGIGWAIVVWSIRSSKIRSSKTSVSAPRTEIVRFRMAFFDFFDSEAPTKISLVIWYRLHLYASNLLMRLRLYPNFSWTVILQADNFLSSGFFLSSAIVISIRRRRPEAEDPQAWLSFYRVSRKAGWEIAEVDSRCESDGRELARSSGRVTLKISSLLLKPDFFLVILSELRRPLRSVRFFCRFCNI